MGELDVVRAVGTSPWHVPNDLWERIDPLLPKKECRFRYPGRLSVPDRQVLCGILYVLHTDIQWEHLPKVGTPPQGARLRFGHDLLAPSP